MKGIILGLSLIIFTATIFKGEPKNEHNYKTINHSRISATFSNIGYNHNVLIKGNNDINSRD